MKMLASVFVVLLVVTVGYSVKISTDNEAFTKAAVVPDVINTAPPKTLKIQYKKTNKEVLLGNELAPKDVGDEPLVTYEADAHAFYTLIMTDPDAPSHKNPVNKEWNHWLVVNIPGSDISKGEVLNAYVGSGPPKDTDFHRYVFLLYKQSGKIKFDEPHKSNTNGQRAKFSTVNFVKKYGLGNAIEGNFFKAQYDDSVPALHKRLG